MRTLYTNEGSFFGYLKTEYLYTYKGLCVGKMVGNNIYGTDGKYLGQISALGYLVRQSSKKDLMIEPWNHQDGTEIPMQAFQFGRIGVGSLKYIDFPSVEDFS